MNKINFQNLPSTATPLNATNMNQLQTNVEDAINEVIERGTNTNGKYVKYADGTMVCYDTVTKTSSIYAYYSSLTRTDDLTVTFPQQFISIPSLTVTPHANQSIGCTINDNGITTSGFTCRLFKAQGATNTTCMYSYIAIGFWK